MKRKQQANRQNDSLLSYESLELGTLAPQDARRFVSQLLEAGVSDEIAESLYESMRILSGRLLRDKCDSEVLRAWYSLIDATSAQFEDIGESWGARIEVLAELLSDRIGLVESRPAQEVLQRRHVPELLEVLESSRNDLVKRAELRDHLGLEEANLSRVLSLLVDAGLVERARCGKEALFSISSAGIVSLLDFNDRIGLKVDFCSRWILDFELEPELIQPGGEIDEYLHSFEPVDPLPLAA